MCNSIILAVLANAGKWKWDFDKNKLIYGNLLQCLSH